MTSDKSGPVRTASPELEEDLDDTRVRKDASGEQAPGDGVDATGTESSSTGTGSEKPAAEPAPPPAPPEPEASGSSVPTTGGVWRSAHEAGRSGTEAAAPEAPTADAAKTPQSASTEPGTSATWNRVQAPDVPPPPVAPAAEGSDGVRSGAMKAAQAALDAARNAAKKVSSIMPDDDERPAAPATPGNARPEMHYTAAGVRGTATTAGAAAPAGATGQQAQPTPAPAPETPRPAPAGPRRVRLAISRVDPWSVMKLAFLLAVAIAIMTVVATAVFWSVLDGFGVFTTVQSFVEDAVGPQSNVNLTQFVEFPRVISLATLVSICNIVLLTAIATIMAFLYNITAALVGGVHLTLTDD